MSTQTKTVSRKKSNIGVLSSATSSPSLNSLYSAHSRLAPTSALARKASFAALTPGSLAAIPDDSESYAHSVLKNESSPTSSRRMAPLTPGKTGTDVAVGDMVDVPGNMYGTVRFMGQVAGRRGNFAGVELYPEFADRGKNNGDVDGVSYFKTETPGAGIFVPFTKLSKRSAPTPSGLRPLKLASQNTTNHTPPAPSLPKFSQSVGPGRSPSPAGKRPRQSLPRPESPVRRLQLNPSRSAMVTPGPMTSVPPPPRYGSPTMKRFASSVRGTTGDPYKPPSRLERQPGIGPRSASALGQTSSLYGDDEATPHATRTKTNGSIGSIASLKMRPSSRAAAADEEEIHRLKLQLEDRDRQLKDQASALAEMESSVTELTALMENTDMGRPRAGSYDDKDTSQLRALLREKNEKIAMLTAEFDAHRADFRSTIDTLEMASTETQRVYDAKIRELEQEIQDLQERTDDVDSVARQLKLLEELVQELEEGLEDARRGEAEARGEVEFLRGEVERTRTELRREREKASAAINGGANGDASSLSKELEKKEDEIRGLKAIIHSLSRDAEGSPDKTPTHQPRTSSLTKASTETIDARVAREKLEREVQELRGVVDLKKSREEELEREIESLRRASAATIRGIPTGDRSSYRDSKGTVILAGDHAGGHKRAATLDTMPESDAYSSVTESSTLWCEICETAGHDILTCTNVFGPQQDQKNSSPASKMAMARESAREGLGHLKVPSADGDVVPRPLTPVKSTPAVVPPPANVKMLPNPTDSGPLAGKDSGVVDPEKWCALCERDGHDSIDCPLEDAF